MLDVVKIVHIEGAGSWTNVMDDPDGDAVISFDARHAYELSGGGDQIMTGIEYRLDVRPLSGSISQVVGRTIPVTIKTRSGTVKMNAMAHPHNDGVRFTVTTNAGTNSEDVCSTSDYM